MPARHHMDFTISGNTFFFVFLYIYFAIFLTPIMPTPQTSSILCHCWYHHPPNHILYRALLDGTSSVIALDRQLLDAINSQGDPSTNACEGGQASFLGIETKLDALSYLPRAYTLPAINIARIVLLMNGMQRFLNSPQGHTIYGKCMRRMASYLIKLTKEERDSDPGCFLGQCICLISIAGLPSTSKNEKRILWLVNNTPVPTIAQTHALVGLLSHFDSTYLFCVFRNYLTRFPLWLSMVLLEGLPETHYLPIRDVLHSKVIHRQLIKNMVYTGTAPGPFTTVKWLALGILVEGVNEIPSEPLRAVCETANGTRRLLAATIVPPECKTSEQASIIVKIGGLMKEVSRESVELLVICVTLATQSKRKTAFLRVARAFVPVILQHAELVTLRIIASLLYTITCYLDSHYTYGESPCNTLLACAHLLGISANSPLLRNETIIEYITEMRQGETRSSVFSRL